MRYHKKGKYEKRGIALCWLFCVCAERRALWLKRMRHKLCLWNWCFRRRSGAAYYEHHAGIADRLGWRGQPARGGAALLQSERRNLFCCAHHHQAAGDEFAGVSEAQFHDRTAGRRSGRAARLGRANGMQSESELDMCGWLPNRGAIDGFPVWVSLNGQAEGLYAWNIPKGAWMFAMDTENKNNIVMCCEGWQGRHLSAQLLCAGRGLVDLSRAKHIANR